jgi:hypothetical protein
MSEPSVRPFADFVLQEAFLKVLDEIETKLSPLAALRGTPPRRS